LVRLKDRCDALQAKKKRWWKALRRLLRSTIRGKIFAPTVKRTTGEVVQNATAKTKNDARGREAEVP